jgi:hypothetical protein
MNVRLLDIIDYGLWRGTGSCGRCAVRSPVRSGRIAQTSGSSVAIALCVGVCGGSGKDVRVLTLAYLSVNDLNSDLRLFLGCRSERKKKEAKCRCSGFHRVPFFWS